MNLKRLSPLFLAALHLVACGDDPSPSETDAGLDVVQDAAAFDVSQDTVDVAEDSQPGTGSVDVSWPEFVPAPASLAAEWVALESPWLVGLTDPDRDDGTSADLDAGRFNFPSLGGGTYGVRWSDAEFDENGGLTNGGNVLQYVVTQFSVDEPTSLVVQGDRSYRIWVDGRRRPGDIYGGVGVRFAYHVEPGEHWIAVQSEGRRGTPTVRAWTTPDPVTFATSDLTLPHLVAGASDVQYLGVGGLVTGADALSPVQFRVVGDDVFEETVLRTPGLGPGATTQFAFELRPNSVWPAGETVSVTIQVESPQLESSIQTTIEVPITEPNITWRRTRYSDVDHSVQYAGIVPPSGEEPAAGWGMVLTLHGAAVQGLGQARAYSAKDWAYIVAPTNRRPFGFDWEVWGRLDALEALADAKERFGFDPERVHVTGHSMGGHGTWQLGSLFPTMFATVGPSAGWDSFYSYGGDSAPGGVFARSQASSLTSNYATTNLQDRAVFVIHGDADDNVPVREARDWVSRLEPFVDDLQYHEQPGAGHWWNGDQAEGADCVDWPALFDTMEDRRLNPTETDFEFLSPSPWVSPTHSFVTVETVVTPLEDFRITSSRDGTTVVVTTTNVERAVLDGAVLTMLGVETVVLDGVTLMVDDAPIVAGVSSEKVSGVSGPFNTAMHQPFCFVYEQAGPLVYAELAAFLSANWSSIGNGHACTVTLENLQPWIEAEHNLIFLGVPPQFIEFDGPVEFGLSGSTLSVGQYSYENSALAVAYPYAGRMGGLMIASDGREDILFRYSPFQSRFVLPDFMVWGDEGVGAAGFFDNDWQLEPAFSSGL
ncbi:MAG: dienelactone hydrolase [Bradymonadia bacterium]|jgi:dienelactone hydrolase